MARAEVTPLVVLVHGGRHDGWSWALVRKALDDRDIESVAPDLPMTGIRHEVEVVRSVLAAAGPREVYLVGHSRGGRVLSALDDATNLRGLMYVAAMLLEENELHPPGHRPRPASALASTSESDLLRAQLYHDVPEQLALEAVRHLRPMAPSALELEPLSGRASWRDRHTTYVVCSDDRYVAPEVQRTMAARAEEVVEIASSHSPFLSHPDELAALVAEGLVRSVAS